MTDYPTSWWRPADGIKSEVPLFICEETRRIELIHDLPVGALFAIHRRDGISDDDWPPVGQDGLSIACVTIGQSHWYIDSRCSNCTMPHDKKHRCWVRHGTYGEKLTVDKNGLTCAAGAGSFFMDGKRWHGFLRDGVLKQD